MNIVIVGAGRLGSHLSLSLSKEQHNVILIDIDANKLEKASWQMDIATRQGSGTDWQLLDDLLDQTPELFIALTQNDETNLVACSIAKNLGYPRTIARVRDAKYLLCTRLDLPRIFDVDYFIGPDYLVAHEIYKFIVSPGSQAIETFAHGSVQLRTIIIPSTWKKGSKKIHELALPKSVMIALIRRSKDPNKPSKNKKVIFPHGDDVILPNDEVTLIGQTERIEDIHQFFGVPQTPIKSAMIIGGSLTGIHLAKILEKHRINVKIVDKDYKKCITLAERLPLSTVIHNDGTNLSFLQSEKVDQADVFITCTPSDETNILSGMLANQIGNDNIIAVLSNTDYYPFVEQMGISHVASPRGIAANRILSLAHSGNVTSLISLYENEAEIIEIQISPNSKVVGIPISELGPLLPKDFLIAIVQNRGKTMIARGDRILSPNDTVIVVTNPKYLAELQRIF